jgi:probable rRNA maturation factor
MKSNNTIDDLFENGLTPNGKLLALMDAARTEVLAREGFAGEPLEADVSFVTEDEIRTYNRDYRDMDSVTDVLSFPQYEHVADIRTAVIQSGGRFPVLLGDVVICRERARQQAAEYGHSIEREIIYLYVHSLLHLFGYDHEEDADKRLMRSAEEAVMNAVGLGEETHIL